MTQSTINMVYVQQALSLGWVDAGMSNGGLSSSAWPEAVLFSALGVLIGTAPQAENDAACSAGSQKAQGSSG